MKYIGRCHCKKVHYEVDFELGEVISCNCSHCQIKGLLLVFVPEDKFVLISGENSQTSYRFNKKTINHLFCKTCGVESYATAKNDEGKEMVAINVRCLDGIDLESLTLKKFNGKDW